MALMSGRVSTAGAPGAVSSAACAPKRRMVNFFAAAGIVSGVEARLKKPRWDDVGYRRDAKGGRNEKPVV